MIYDIESQLKCANLYTLRGNTIIPDNPGEALALTQMYDAGAFGGRSGDVSFNRDDALVFQTQADAEEAYEELSDQTTS